MKQDSGKRALEKYRIFPFIAWGLIFGFAFFVYNLTINLEAATSELGQRTTTLEQQISADPETVNFETN